jgi:predicted transposase YbfD/YdcC
MDKIYRMPEYFEEVELTEEHKGYFCSVKEALAIVILGSFCGLKNLKQIHQWSSNSRILEFLREYFKIRRIPCYFWLTCLLKLIKPKSLNECFVNWVQSMLPESKEGYTVSFDGKTVRSTNKMSAYDSPLHIVSAHIAELGITFGQETVYDKSNEIPAVRELIKLLNLKGCLVVADALNCQKETAKAIIASEADYLLSVKDNQENLREDIEDYVQDKELRQTMDKKTTYEKNRERLERRTAYVTDDIKWLYGKDEWVNLTCIGAINTQTTNTKSDCTTKEWHYYISSRSLTAEELLKHARLEWSVESMHWLLDVHFGEDFCRVEDKNVQQTLNIIRKIVLNSIKVYKDEHNVKRPLSNIMLDCLIDPDNLILLLDSLG